MLNKAVCVTLQVDRDRRLTGAGRRSRRVSLTRTALRAGASGGAADAGAQVDQVGVVRAHPAAAGT
jgi:hypothetical protein